jgi:hypothetical protein
MVAPSYCDTFVTILKNHPPQLSPKIAYEPSTQGERLYAYDGD